MRWAVKFSKTGERDLGVLDRSVRREIIDHLGWVALNFESIAPFPLHGKWKGFFKLRVRDWRVIYKFDSPNKLISICIIDHRDKIYKRSAD